MMVLPRLGSSSKSDAFVAGPQELHNSIDTAKSKCSSSNNKLDIGDDNSSVRSSTGEVSASSGTVPPLPLVQSFSQSTMTTTTTTMNDHIASRRRSSKASEAGHSKSAPTSTPTKRGSKVKVPEFMRSQSIAARQTLEEENPKNKKSSNVNVKPSSSLRTLKTASMRNDSNGNLEVQDMSLPTTSTYEQRQQQQQQQNHHYDRRGDGLGVDQDNHSEHSQGPVGGGYRDHQNQCQLSTIFSCHESGEFFTYSTIANGTIVRDEDYDDPPKKHTAKEEASSLRSNMTKLCFGISAFRDGCGTVVNDSRVQIFILSLIVLNSILMGLATFDFVEDNPAVLAAFELTDRIFLIIFTVESGLQLICHGFNLFMDGWLLFDFTIVVLSWALQSFQVVRAFRIFRAVRLIARLAVLQNIILSIFAVAPSLVAILMLLCLILYVYAVLVTNLYGDLYAEGYTDQDYFGTLFLSLFTLFQMMTLEWSTVVRQVKDKYYWSSLLFGSFLVLTGFILYSLIIAVVCDAVKVQEHKDEQRQHLEEKEETRHRVFALEQRIAVMTEYQTVIVEQLRHVVNEVGCLHENDDGGDEEEKEGEEQEVARDGKPVDHGQLMMSPPPLVDLNVEEESGGRNVKKVGVEEESEQQGTATTLMLNRHQGDSCE